MPKDIFEIMTELPIFMMMNMCIIALILLILQFLKTALQIISAE